MTDFNRDGKADLAVANGNGPAVSVILGRGDGTFQTAVSYGKGGSFSLVVADFNGDSNLDLVGGPGSIFALAGNGDGTFRTGINYVAGGFPRSLAYGDFNGDNYPDLAVADANNVWIVLNSFAENGPALVIARNGASRVISWPGSATGFRLESTTNLTPANWQPATETAATNRRRLELNIPVNAPQRFFRLRQP